MSWERRLATSRPSLIVGGRGRLDELGDWAREAKSQGRRIFVVTDSNVTAAWGERLTALLRGAPGDQLVLPPGERTKDVANLSAVWEWLAVRGARRDDVAVAFGGGVIGDLAGFAAATYLRGLTLWQIPTSLIAQVDSSVGGKVAVDLPAGKNLVGSFYQPDCVLIDPELLATLPADEYAAGWGEVVKYAVLDSEDFLDLLEREVGAIRERDPEVLDAIVRRCVDYKADVVDDDETDRGRRAVLNLGHTTAHALETACGYGAMPHGVAVALGLLVSLAVSEEMLGCDPELRKRIRCLLTELGLPCTTELPPDAALLEAATRDKKRTAAGMGFVGLRGCGDPVRGLDVPDDVFLRNLEVLRP